MSGAPRTIGLIFKQHDPRVEDILRDLVPWLAGRRAEVLVDEAVARHAPKPARPCPAEELPARSEAVAVFGGDGTFLYAARLAAGSATPILGVNLGSLGFLTEVKLEETKTALGALLEGRFELEERMLLEVEAFRAGNRVGSYRALNDVVINKGALARIIEVEVTVDGQVVALYRSDGLILSTPTGSTAYSLSAGGPILYPTLGAFIITPICPHTLTNRPVVVPDRSDIAVQLREGADVMLTVDGQVGMPLVEGDQLRLRRSDSTIRMIQPQGSHFFKILREKLKWG